MEGVDLLDDGVDCVSGLGSGVVHRLIPGAEKEIDTCSIC